MQKILLAEDDSTMISLLNTLLKMEGFQVATINLEEQVLRAVEREKPDVLLLDVYLPNESGLDIVKALRASDKVKNTRVVMTSGMSLKTECLENGADAFLLKPYMPSELIDMLHQQLGNKS